MILVTVGTPQQSFDRLVRAMDEFAAQNSERVVIQTGTATYAPEHAESFRWTTSREMERLTAESRIVVTQASAGATILAVRYGKPLIVVPRRKKYGEHFNDHQHQLALALQKDGQAVVVEEPTLAEIQRAVKCAPLCVPIQSRREGLVHGLRGQIEAWQRIEPNERERALQ